MAEGARTLTAADVAALTGGRLDGDASLTVTAVGPLDRAHGGTVSFLSSVKYRALFEVSGAGVVLVPADFPVAERGPRTVVVVADPPGAMARVLAAMFPVVRPPAGIHPTAIIGRGARVGEGASIGARVVIGPGSEVGSGVALGVGVVLEAGVRIGADSRLDPNVVCYPGVEIGSGVTIEAGTVLGGSGFGFISDRTGHHPIPHVGGCRIGDGVRIGANCCVDRGSVDDTVIGAGTRLDNHVHVGHNARIGERCLLMGGVVVAGSARIGNDVILAGHSAVGGHFTVGDGARVGAKAGVISSVPAGTDVSGFPARPHREFLRAQAALYRLAPLVGDIEALIKERSTSHG